MDISKFYYHLLTDEQKEIYKLMCNGLSVLNCRITLPIIPKNSLSLINKSVLLDNPVFFYATAFRYAMNLSSQKIILTPMYRYSNNVIKQSADALNGYLKLFDIVKHKTDIEKELFVHDFCLEHFTYDYTFNEHSFSPLGLLIYKAGVCEGISRFVKLALDYLNVECMLVSGTAINAANQKPVPHMWNIVKINGNTYHLDVTFDMSQTTKIKRYDYFNLPDNEIEKDHVIISSVPKCTTFCKDYYFANSLVFNNLHAIENHIRKELLNGKRHIVIKLNSRRFGFDTAVIEQITNAALRQFQRLYNQVVTVAVSCNPTQCVFEIIFN